MLSASAPAWAPLAKRIELCFGPQPACQGRPMKPLLLAASLLIGALPALAQTPSIPADDEQKVLLRGLVEAVRANTEALNQERNALDTLSSRLERVETAVRTVSPS